LSDACPPGGTGLGQLSCCGGRCRTTLNDRRRSLLRRPAERRQSVWLLDRRPWPWLC